MDKTVSQRLKRVAAPLRQEVANTLREAIVTAEIGPGERLVESVLCERYGVSRTVIREVLRQLESEGLVRTVANRGPEVATLTLSEAESLYDVRGALESLAGQLFARRATASEREDLRKASERVVRAINRDDIHKKLAIKDDYYEALLRGAHSEEIGRQLRLIHARTQVLRVYSLQSPNRGPRTLEEIEAITRNAIAGDEEATRIACVTHVESAAEAALSEMRRQVAD